MRYRNPISILHLITTLDVGGAEMMLLKLLSEIDRTHFSSHVVSLTDIGSVGERISERGIPIYALNMPHGRLTLRGLIKLWRLLRTIRPIVLQTWLYHADFLGIVLGKLAGIHNICWNIRCSYLDLKQYRSSTKWTIMLCSLLSFFPKVIITNSRAALKFHIDLGYRKKGWKVIPNGFDLKQFRPDHQAKPKLLLEIGVNGSLKNEFGEQKNIEQLRHENSIVLIGFIARYDPMKNHSNFINAACLLLKQIKNVHFILVGRGIQWENKNLSKQIPMSWSRYFHLLGERKDVAYITASFDIASSVSDGEGFPNIICEAMACGVPCVVTDVGDSATIVGDTGRVVPPGDPKALAKAWKELIDLNDKERHRLGLLARSRIMEQFELSQIARKYEFLYTSIVMGETRN